MFTLVATRHFLRSARKFLKSHPDLKSHFARVLNDLQRDLFAPHLAFHRLTGKFKGMHAVRITDRYRITLTIAIIEEEIILLDIGSHEEVYR